MGNNNLKTANDILVKVDQNNLIYIDPNSVLVNGEVQPRAVEPENLMMYVNLEADLIPRSILVSSDEKNSLMSIAKGSLNFLKRKDGRDLDTTWTESYVNVKGKTTDQPLPVGAIPFFNEEYRQSDDTGQSFGIVDIKIDVKGANFIPRVIINFLDVRGKTLMESPQNSPYSAFFHLPWPIFYLTVKGYYGKAIRYRLHMIKFNSRYNSSSGNFEITTEFIGSTYAYLADISMESVLNAPYFYASENEVSTKFNESTGFYDKTISKTTKGYRVLRSVYQEYINKGLLPKDFPVKTLREIIVVAGRLNKILEKEVFSQIVNHHILSAVKDYEEIITNFEESIKAWQGRYLSPEYFTEGTNRNRRWFKLTGQDKNTLIPITGSTVSTTLEGRIKTFTDLLDKNEAFGTKRTTKFSSKDKIKTNTISCASLKNIKEFYIVSETVGVDIDELYDRLYKIQKDFVEQRNKLESDIETQMNNIVARKDIGIGFEPTIRNIMGVVLANAETYIRLMKDVHYKAFENAEVRRKILGGVLTDTDKSENAIYPWPEVKAQTAGGKEMVLLYPGCREMAEKLQSYNRNLWPEVDFVENFYDISTHRTDNLAEKEGNTDKVNYIFDSTIDSVKKDISVLTNLTNYIPYTNKSVASILFEIYERAKYTTSLTPFSNGAIIELANIEYNNLKEQVIDDIDIVETLKNSITDYPKLLTTMESVSPFDKYPYYQDQLPTISYIKDGLAQDFSVLKYTLNTGNTISYNSEYTKVSEFVRNYKPEEYRKSIYPFNSSTYLTENLSQTEFKPSNLNLNGLVFVDTPENFLASPLYPSMWVKDGFTSNIFTNTITVDGVEKHILNTPYFHKQLYDDFTTNPSQGKYVGSAYLLLNSLPFKDLDDYVDNKILQYFSKGVLGNEPTLVSTIFRELGATHYIPYHMMLKWGSIYHRYKKGIEGSDIINVEGSLNMIDGAEFFDGNSGYTYTAISGKTIDRTLQKDVGIHPYYETIFHNIVNNYLFFDTTVSDYTDMITSGATRQLYQETTDANLWTTFVDNSKFDFSDKRYTFLPCNGNNTFDGRDFVSSEQENFRILWGIGTSGTIGEEYVDYTGRTFPQHTEYFKLTGGTGEYSLDANYRKVVDLIATFKPEILDVFEEAFLDFASEKLNEEVSYRPYDVTYGKFQDLLKKMVSVSKNDNDPVIDIDLVKKLKERQTSELSYLSNEILSNNNLIRLILSNPREIDNYVLGGFTDVGVEHFSVNTFDPTQLTLTNLNNIKLYLGEDLDLYYRDFFIVNDIELSEDNIKQFRFLIYVYAGLRAKGVTPTKSEFITYLEENIVTPVKNSVTDVSGQEQRLSIFLTQLIYKIQSSDFKIKEDYETSPIKRGYNDDNTVKLELYNYFKSFNDKWTSGNSIGQRTLMEEFLFLDKANRDVGDSVYLDLEKIIRFGQLGNEKINLYSMISLLVQDTGFDIRALPAYVNFYGTNFSTTGRIMPSKNVARNMFGNFMEVDYQDSSPKIILQFIGPTSKHLELSDINNKYKYKNDGFDIGNVNKNPIIVAPDVFTKTDFSKSNKVVAFEVSFGDQNQSIFKGVELDQTSIRNTSESFVVLERLGRSETGASTAQVDIGLFDIYRQSSYQCQVTAMGNAMIQPTMYFYLKNIPLFRGSYWITEVSHTIRTTGIETTFKGTRIPQQSLPNPTDSFLASYRSLFDKLVKRAKIKVAEELSGTTSNQKVITTSAGSYSVNTDNIKINGEKLATDAGYMPYGIPYNGFDEAIDKDIQLIYYNGVPWLRAKVAEIGGKIYTVEINKEMSIVSRLTTGIDTPKIVKWGDIKGLSETQDFYVTRFNLKKIDPNQLVTSYPTTSFFNPTPKRVPLNTWVQVQTNISSVNNRYEGPISVGPPAQLNTLTSDGYRESGYGIGMSKSLMKKLNLYDGDIVYFKLY